MLNIDLVVIYGIAHECPKMNKCVIKRPFLQRTFVVAIRSVVLHQGGSAQGGQLRQELRLPLQRQEDPHGLEGAAAGVPECCRRRR